MTFGPGLTSRPYSSKEYRVSISFHQHGIDVNQWKSEVRSFFRHVEEKTFTQKLEQDKSTFEKNERERKKGEKKNVTKQCALRRITSNA